MRHAPKSLDELIDQPCRCGGLVILPDKGAISDIKRFRHEVRVKVVNFWPISYRTIFHVISKRHCGDPLGVLHDSSFPPAVPDMASIVQSRLGWVLFMKSESCASDGKIDISRENIH
jgi:hypothetical protein